MSFNSIPTIVFKQTGSQRCSRVVPSDLSTQEANTAACSCRDVGTTSLEFYPETVWQPGHAAVATHAVQRLAATQLFEASPNERQQFDVRGHTRTAASFLRSPDPVAELTYYTSEFGGGSSVSFDSDPEPAIVLARSILASSIIPGAVTPIET